jgi:hypothetical protein
MDGDAFLDSVRESNATALNRLGSEKALIANTSASLDRQTVLETTATAELRAAETFEAWAADEASERASEAFADAAERERTHYERVCELGEIDDIDPDADALHTYLRGLDETVPRAAPGLVARPLIASRSLLQVINFFVNEGDDSTANVFRELRKETDEQAKSGTAVLEDIYDADDWNSAEDAATAAIETAYEEYADRLEEMGVDPKPVC